MNEEVLRLLGELMSGIAVPGSMSMLGVGEDPWRKLLSHEKAPFGYASPEDWTNALRRMLES